MSDKEIALELIKAFLASTTPQSDYNGGAEAFKDKAATVFETYKSFYEKIKELE
jgi:hypothetical protein